ncbi:MAG: amidohydrolase family protein [Gemmatimonadota bacterium]
MPSNSRPSRVTTGFLVLATSAMILPFAGGVQASPAEGWAPPTEGLLEVQADTVEEAESNGGLPLAPERTLEFAVDEGTWISVDVSPDGSTLVFDLLGDLYTLPMDGGEATPLTRGIAYDAQPRFSRDGSRVLFVSDRSGGENLWTISLDGSDTTQVTRGESNIYTSPEWTPDGEYIVASRTHGLGGTAKLWIFHAEGGTGIQLISEPGNLKTLGPTFDPDARYIWYAEATGDWEYNADLPRYQLARLDRYTGERRSMTRRYGSGFRPRISPDGRWLVYGSRYESDTGLVLRDLETGEEEWLAYPVQRDDQEARATLDILPGYAFTPDSREIVVSYGGKLWRVPLDGSDPAEIPFNAQVRAEIGPQLAFDYPVDDSPVHTAREIRDAVPSPDGSRIAFTAFDRVWVADLPARAGEEGVTGEQEIGAPRRLTEGRQLEFHPTWSPDGAWVAFGVWTEEDEGHLARVRADGSGALERLTPRSALYQRPVWSPAGDRILAVRGDARDMREEVSIPSGGLTPEFVHLPASGGEVTIIGPTAGRSFPHFTEDPDRIFAHSGSDGLVSFRWDGTDERRHLRVTGHSRAGGSEPSNASRIVMSPNGTEALADVDDNLFLVHVPRVGEEPPVISVTNPERAAMPAWQLTEIGGHFPAWSADGSRVHWSIGSAHFVHHVPTGRAASSEEDDYEPMEVRVQVERARDIPSGAVVLRGARAITMRDHEIIEDADILVRDNRIVAVGARGEVEVPDEAEIIDLAGATVVPGFIDTHAHIRPPFQVHSPQPWAYLANLAYGVTTTRDPQTSTTDVLTYGDRVEVGDIIGPRVFSTGPGVFNRYRGQPVQSLDHARNILRKYSDYYHTESFKMYLAGNRQERQWLVMAARELGLMPTTEAGIDYKLDITHALDGYPGIEHNLPITPIYEDVVQLFAESGVANTPTLLVTFGAPQAENFWYSEDSPWEHPKMHTFTPYSDLANRSRRRGTWVHPDEHMFPRFAEFVRDVVAAGGRMGVGSHGQLQGLGYHWELWSMQAGGLPEHDALRVATILGAEALGMDGDLGSIEPGKLADLVVVDGDPLSDIRDTNTIRFVMKNGRLYEGDTLREVWPEERAAPQPLRVDDVPNPRAGIR